MKSQRKPFPVRRTDTITCVNVRMAVLHVGNGSAADVANWIIPSANKTLAEPRHIERAARLME